MKTALLCCLDCDFTQLSNDLERLKILANEHRKKNPGHEPRWDVAPKGMQQHDKLDDDATRL